MKRWLLAVTALLGGAIGLAHADYVIIIANLTGAKVATGGNTNQPGIGQPPGGGGIRPGGGGGIVGPMPPGGGGGIVGPMPPGGGGGIGPMPPGGGGGIGPFPPGGGGGIGPFPPGGGSGSGPIRPGGGGPGSPDGGMGYYFPGEGSGISSSFFENPLDPIFVVAVVETTKDLNPTAQQMLVRGIPLRIEHKWGSTNLFQAVNEKVVLRAIPMTEASGTRVFNLKAHWDRRVKDAKEIKDDPARSMKALLENAEWALMHGLTKEFEVTIAEAAKLDANNTTVKTVQEVLDKLNKGSPEGKDGPEWQARLKLTGYKSITKPHYVLYHGMNKADAPEAVSKITRLEENLRRYYLWFALRGRSLPMPEQKLVAVLPGKVEEFRAHHLAFDSVPLISDGFAARRENLVVFSPNRIDRQYTDLFNYVKPVLDQMPDSSSLLKGTTPVNQQNYQSIYALQTLVLMRKALEEEADLTTASREGSRQLLAVSGLLPRTVTAPEWVQFGTASFFETAKGTPWPTVGSAGMTMLEQTNYLANFKKWQKDPKRDKLDQALLKVVTDTYFRQIPKAKEDGEEEDPKVTATRLSATKQAHTLAWGATYFFFNNKLTELTRYFDELATLPRDLEFDEDVLKVTFAKAFDLLDKSGQVNQAKLLALAKEWDRYLDSTPIDPALKDAFESVENLKKEVKNATIKPPEGGQGGFPGGGPMGPMGPGGGIP